MNQKYRESLTEVNTIFNFMEKKYIIKIPSKLKQFICDNMDKNYIPNINVNKKLSEQDINQDTKILLSLIYRTYWCEEEKRKILLEKETIRENEKNKKYDYNEFFFKKKKNVKEEKTENNKLILKKERFLEKILKKIKEIIERIK